MTDSLAPSSIWNGTPVADSRWTFQQLHVLRAQGGDPELCATGTIARRAKVHPEDWTRPAPIIRTELPCLAVTRDRKRAKLVTPAGATQWFDIVEWKGPRNA